jgi:hypothetical protein
MWSPDHVQSYFIRKNLGYLTSELKKNLLVLRRLICLLFSKWRDWDLNPEPMAYESTAPPLSYLAQCPKILPEIYVKVKHFDVFALVIIYLKLNSMIISEYSPPPREGDSRG